MTEKDQIDELAEAVANAAPLSDSDRIATALETIAQCLTILVVGGQPSEDELKRTRRIPPGWINVSTLKTPHGFATYEKPDGTREDIALDTIIEDDA